LLDHYLHAAYGAARELNPHRDPITLEPPDTGVHVEAFAGHESAFAWLTAEYVVLRSCVRQAADTGFDGHVWRYAWSLEMYTNRRGHWQDLVDVQRMALAATLRLADPAAQARAHHGLSRGLMRLGRYPEAYHQLDRALDIYRLLGDRVRQAHIQLSYAVVLNPLGRIEDALRHSLVALDLYRLTDHEPGQANALNAAGWYCAHLGRYEDSLDHCERALAILRKIDNPFGEAPTWDTLGYAHFRRGDHRRALDCHDRALTLFRELGDRYNEADVLRHLADDRVALGDSNGARAALRRALAILDELQHADADEVRARLRDLHPRDAGEPASA
jgi:tetratricopeptide (TPR) repeat protein